MENPFKNDFSPQNERGEELTARNEKSQQRANMEATGQTRPHFRTLEEAHAYFKELDKAKQANSSSITFKRLKDYHDYNTKAQEAIIQLREGIKASMGIAHIPNQITLKNGDYNPNYVEWLEGNLTNSALSLCEILTYDSIDNKEGFIAVRKDKAQELINDMQYSVNSFKEEAHAFSYALEYYNYYVAYIEERGLKEDFKRYVSGLWLAK